MKIYGHRIEEFWRPKDSRSEPPHHSDSLPPSRRKRPRKAKAVQVKSLEFLDDIRKRYFHDS